MSHNDTIQCGNPQCAWTGPQYMLARVRDPRFSYLLTRLVCPECRGFELHYAPSDDSRVVPS